MLGLSSGLIKGTSVLRSIVKKGLQAWYKADQTQAPLGEEEIANGNFNTGPELVSNGDFSDGITGWSSSTYNLASQATIEDKGGYVRLSNTPDVQITGAGYLGSSNQVTHDGSVVIDDSYIGRYLRNSANNGWMVNLQANTFITATDPENNSFTINHPSTGPKSNKTITLTTDWRGKMLRQPLSGLTSGKIYQVKFKVRGNVASNQLFVRTNYTDNDGEVAANKNVTTDWVEHTYYVTAHADSGDISFGLYHWYLNGGTSGSDVNNDWIEIDDVTVKQTNPNDSWLVENSAVVKDGEVDLGTSNGRFSQTALTTGKTYQYSFKAKSVAASGCNLKIDSPINTNKVLISNIPETYTSYSGTFIAGGSSIVFKESGNPGVTISDVSVKEITNSVKDFSPNANNGVLHSGKCLHFDQANNYIDIDYWASKTIDANTKATFATWVNPDDVAPGDYIFGAWGVDTDALFYLGTKQQNLDLGWGNSGWTDTSLASGTLPVLANHTWYRVAAVVDGLTCKVYLNGEFVFSKTNDSSFTINSEGISIGAQGDDHGDHFYGELADFQIYDKAWTASDVKYDWENPDKDVFDDEGRAEVLGAELITNTWSQKESTVVSTFSNGIRVDNSGGNNNSGPYQNLSLVAGKHYSVTATMKIISSSSTGPGDFTIITSNASGNNQVIRHGGDNDLIVEGVAVTKTVIVEAGDVSMQFSCDLNNSIFEVSNVSVKEVLTHAGEISPTDCTALYRLNEGAGNRIYNAAPVLSAELVSNSDFSQGDNGDFTVVDSTASSITIANGKATYNIVNGENAYIRQLFGIVSGKTYKLSITLKGLSGLSSTSNQVRVQDDIDAQRLGINVNPLLIDLDGTIQTVETIWTAGSGSDSIIVMRNDGGSSDNYSFEVHNLSVKEISLSESYVQENWVANRWITAQPYIPQYAMSSYSKKAIFGGAGSGDYVELGTDNITIPAADPFSFSFWYYNIDESSDQIVLGKDGDSNQLISIDDGNKGIRFKVSSPNDAILDFDNDLTKGKLNHIVLTNAGGSTSNGLKCYVNGVLQSDTENSLNTDFGFRWICRSDSSYGEGFIDELAHFSKELSATEVQEIFNAGIALDCRDHSAYLGSEMVSNGDFSSIGSELVDKGDFTGITQAENITGVDWITQAGWTISGGKASANTTTSKALIQNISVVDTKLYNVSFEISDFVKGSLQLQFDGYVIPSVWGNGVYNFTVSSQATNVTLYLYAMNESKFSIDNVSIKEIEGGWSALEGSSQLLGWSQTGWSIANGKASVDHNKTDITTMGLSKSSFGQVAGKSYSLSFEISDYVSGDLIPQFSSQALVEGGIEMANGVYNYIVSAVNTNSTFYLYAINSPKFSIDNISIKEVDLKGYWRNNGTDTWYDLSPYGNDGTVNGSPTTIQLQEVPYFKKDTFGLPMNKVRQKGLNFDGDSYVKVDDDSSLGAMDTAFTCAFWYRHAEDIDSSDWFWLVTKGTGHGAGVDNGLAISSYDNKIFAHLNTANGQFQSDYTISAASPSAPVWHYVTVTYDGSNLILYTNETLRESTAVTGDVSATAEAYPLMVGTNHDNSNNKRARGVIDEVKWYNRALGLDEIKKNYKATKSKHSSTSSWSDDFSDSFI